MDLLVPFAGTHCPWSLAVCDPWVFSAWKSEIFSSRKHQHWKDFNNFWRNFCKSGGTLPGFPTQNMLWLSVSRFRRVWNADTSIYDRCGLRVYRRHWLRSFDMTGPTLLKFAPAFLSFPLLPCCLTAYFFSWCAYLSAVGLFSPNLLFLICGLGKKGKGTF